MDSPVKKSVYWEVITGLSMCLYVTQASFFGSWLVDDAGISLAYAVNWAEGYGLVDQTGKVPVEGYSNFVWVSLLALLHKLGTLFIPLSPKFLGMGFGLLSIHLLKQLAKNFYSPLAGSLLILIIPNHPSIVQWSVSGLETGLYLFLILWFTLRLVSKKSSSQDALLMGSLISLLSLTRPEGVLLAIVFPVLLWRQTDSFWKSMIAYLAPIMLLLGGYELFRLSYFGDFLPNTFYVKGWQRLDAPALWLKPHHLAKGIFGPAGLAGVLGLILLLVQLFKKNLWNPQLTILSFLTTVGALQFLLMPYDHLGWYRYAILFIVGGFSLVLMALDIMIRKSTVSFIPASLGQGVLLGGASLFLLYAFLVSWKRCGQPAVPLEQVKERASLVKKIAKEEGMTTPSVLTPDAGGFLLTEGIEVYDLPGLCNRRLANTFGKDQADFEEYLFRELQPDVITLHGLWTAESKLEENPEFLEAYRLVYSAPHDQESPLLIFIRH